jgi:cyclophilin family peptidyl-prolyl cis-trans isomerase
LSWEWTTALKSAYRDSPGVEWVEVREGIVDGVKETPKAIDLMREMLVDDAPSVRRKAAAALAAHGIEIEPPPFAVGPSPYLHERPGSDPRVVLHMERGEIVIRCFAQEAPIHVAAFLDLVRQHFYSDLSWHRVVPNFVIQGGDPRGDGWGGAGFTLRDEIGRRRFKRGTVGMPKAGKDTGGGQLFITHVPTPHLDGNYTIFGQVTEGLELVDAIEIGDRIIWAEIR